MWGRLYWGRKDEGERKAKGIVVLFAWLNSHEKHLKPYVDLYWSLGWGSLVCHVDFITLFFPEKGAILARGILDELIKEIKIRPLPIVLVAFSGGSKGCLYKLLQLVEGKCEGQLSLQDDCRLVRLCLCGQIYDSSPVDFTSDLGTKYVLQPSVLKMSNPPRAVTWIAKAFGSSLNALFTNRFETDSADYWKALYSSVGIGPFQIFGSKDDELAPYKIVCGFAQHLTELGGDVNVMIWSSSPHVAHYRYHKAEYKAAVTQFLAKASSKYSRTNHLRRTFSSMILESASNLRNATLKRAAVGSTSLFLAQTSMEVDETTNVAGSPFHEQNGELLGNRLGDVCGPKEIEDREFKQISDPNKSSTISSTNFGGRRDKCIRRPRL